MNAQNISKLKKVLMVTIAITLVATAIQASDCVDHFNAVLAAQTGIATVISLNNNGIASYSTLSVNAVRSRPPARFASLSGQGNQLFNDRVRGAQPFDVAKADKLRMDITNVNGSVTITFTLLSWNNGKVSFSPSCDGALMHGCTADKGACYVVQLIGASIQ